MRVERERIKKANAHRARVVKERSEKKISRKDGDKNKKDEKRARVG